jgi:lipoic acid synthetase
MILGNECTRNCRFCAVPHNKKPRQNDLEEPERVAEAAARMKLRHVVVTSVTRDDLSDGGSAVFAATIRTIRAASKNVAVEVLTPDYLDDSLKTVLAERPDVFNHNVETVERLSAEVRSKARYRRSLDVLSSATEISAGNILIKSGLMVGMGETDDEVERTIRDIRAAGTDTLTIGQYLPPSNSHWPLDRYVHPDKFDEWKELALSLGFERVASAPMVRSSYHAGELSKAIPEGGAGNG